MTIKLTTDKAAVVSTMNKWIPITTVQPPENSLCLLINRKFGTSRLDKWNRKSDATHWYPLPTWQTGDENGKSA